MNKNKYFKIGSTFFIVLLLFLLSFLFKISTIQVTYPDGSFYLEDDTFEIGWIHSVEKEPWYETYTVKDQQLYLETTRFKTFGAGTPSDGEIIPSDDGYIHMRINREIETIDLVVSKNIKTTLYTKTAIIPLYEQLNDYEVVNIKVVKLPIWQFMWGENK